MYSLRALLASLSLLVAVAACGGPAANQPDPGPSGPDQSGDGQSASAKLVVAVVFDQMPSGALLRYAEYLDPKGAMRRAMEGGLFVERVRYDYAGTNTAPGHASIHTGEVPADHGVDANDVFDPERKARITAVDDGKHPVFGREEVFASPWRLLKPTVGDRLRDADEASKVVSVSLKARAAVVSGGQKASFAGWYEPSVGRFTTSTFYGDELPAWVNDFNEANPVAERIGVWETDDAELYEKLLGPDDAEGESDWKGFGTTFPHDPNESEFANKTFTTTPQSVDYLLDFARAAAAEYELGVDEHPDLLCISISSTDYAGHTFGQGSWEYIDVLRKADAKLGALIDELSATTDVAVLITSDHGGTPLAEATLAAGKVGGRLGADEVVADLEARLDKELGDGDWVQANIQPYLYLTDQGMKKENFDRIVPIAKAYAESHPGIYGIYTPDEARGWRSSEDAMERDVANTVAERTTALFVVPAEGYVASPSKSSKGTGHGTPWDPDREVPLLSFGAGVGATHLNSVEKQQRVAATLAALLGMSWPLAYQPFEGTPR